MFNRRIMLNRRILSVLVMTLFLFSIFSSTKIEKAEATSGAYTYTMPTNSPSDYLENTQLQHSSGKYYTIWYNGNNNDFILKGFAQTGTIILETLFHNLINLGNDQNPNLYVRTKLFDINSSILGIAILYSGVGRRPSLFIVEFNVDTHNYDTTNAYYTISMIQDTTIKFSSLEMNNYNDYFYFIGYYVVGSSVGSPDSPAPKLLVFKYNTKGRTLTNVIAHQLGDYYNANTPSKISIYQNASTLYAMFSLPDNNILVKYYRIDLEGLEVELLSTHPYYYERFDTSRYTKVLGAGIYTNAGYNYLYFTWVYPYTPTSGWDGCYKIIQHRMKFNGTVIEENLVDVNERLLGLSIPCNRLYSHKNFAVGYLDGADTIILWYPYGNGQSVIRRYFLVPEIINFERYDITPVSDVENEYYEFDNEEIQYYSWKDQIDKIPYSTFEFAYSSVDNNYYIYFGFGALIQLYDLQFSYSPYETPLKINKEYTIYIQCNLNGVGHQTLLIVYLNGIQKLSLTTDASGLLTTTLTISHPGEHILLAKVYDNNLFKYEEAKALVFSDVETPTEPSTTLIIPSLTNAITTFLPVFFMIFLPALLFATKLGTVGFMIGASLGTLLASMTGIIPTYFTFIVVLLIAIIFVLSIKGTLKSGSENDE